MAKKEVLIQPGDIIVILDDKYDATPKDIPDDALKETGYTWLGNFKITEDGEKPKGKGPKYQVMVEDQDEKILYYWDGRNPHPVPNQKKVEKDKKKFRIGDLDLADPPVGWNR